MFNINRYIADIYTPRRVCMSPRRSKDINFRRIPKLVLSRSENSLAVAGNWIRSCVTSYLMRYENATRKPATKFHYRPRTARDAGATAVVGAPRNHNVWRYAPRGHGCRSYFNISLTFIHVVYWLRRRRMRHLSFHDTRAHVMACDVAITRRFECSVSFSPCICKMWI